MCLLPGTDMFLLWLIGKEQVGKEQVGHLHQVDAVPLVLLIAEDLGVLVEEAGARSRVGPKGRPLCSI